jgi:NAD(P)-dependent dehydrogenase (short-subunit alcohol dehydrogenase family)
MARALAQAGANIALCSRHADEARQAAREIAETTGRRTAGFEADITRSDSIARLATDVTSAIGPVDILVNNAGCNVRKPVAELTEEDWDFVVDTSAKGSFLCSKAFLPGMIERKWGRIVMMGSIMSFVSLPGRAAYSTAKAALLGLARTLSLEGAPHGVNVNLICPGPFETPMNRVLMNDPEAFKAFLAKIPLGRWGQPEELGGAIVYLCSPAAAFVTGTCLVIDGGWTVT